MLNGKKFKTLIEAKKYQELHPSTTIYNLKNPIYKYFVGTHIQWLNL